jgi:alkanesulfonate monooxygenase SsuD/methylene tetrahydromethanopterin reductase-like flavin-dependent oxidoreductase (luciferase family)
MLSLIGRMADGWVPSSGWMTPARLPEMNARIDAAAQAAGRKPSDIRRIYNVAGRITDGERRDFLDGPATYWAEELTRLAVDQGMDAFIFWPVTDATEQLRRFVEEVAPAVRSNSASERSR